MMKSLYKVFNYSLLVVVYFFACSCSKDETSELVQSIYPESITINIPQEIKYLIYKDENGTDVLPLLKGEEVSLGYTMLPENITFNDAQWSTSDAKVVEINEEGRIRAVNGDGETYSIIQAAPSVFYTGSGIYGVLKVVVSNEIIQATKVTVSADTNQIYTGETLQLGFSIHPQNTTYRTVKWSSSDESLATVDENGVVKAAETIDGNRKSVTITATSIDGAHISASKEITIIKSVPPESVELNQDYSVERGCVWAITDKTVKLKYTTKPTESTTSLIEWSSSDESIATVNNGIVTFNQKGIFGNVTITALCPATGNTSSITLGLEDGLIRELFDDKDNYTWYNAKQSANGTESSHDWHDGYLTITTYTQSVGSKQRGDFKCWSPKTWLHAGKYPIFAVRMEDVADKHKEEGVTERNIILDASGTCNGNSFSGALGGGNNKYKYNYKCSDGSHVFIYDLSSQGWATGGQLPTNSIAEFTTLQFKYADIAKIDHQIQYNVYWVQTFKNIEELDSYLDSEGLTYEK